MIALHDLSRRIAETQAAAIDDALRAAVRDGFDGMVYVRPCSAPAAWDAAVMTVAVEIVRRSADAPPPWPNCTGYRIDPRETSPLAVAPPDVGDYVPTLEPPPPPRTFPDVPEATLVLEPDEMGY